MASNPDPSAIASTEPQTKSHPEVFIIESLDFDNEEAHMFEGRVLADVLRMCGKNPIYYYFRTREELQILSTKFQETHYRYLHVSCHGGSGALHTTLGHSILYSEFADVFRGKLKNRRLFVSACAVGTKQFCNALALTNKGMYSMAAPAEDIDFDHAVALWAAFYVRVFSISDTGMKKAGIGDTLRQLCRLFAVRFFWGHYAPDVDKWRHRHLG